jgi:hypothetical protein
MGYNHGGHRAELMTNAVNGSLNLTLIALVQG